MYIPEHASHYGLSKEAQEHAQQVLRDPEKSTLDALSQQPLYNLNAELPAPFRPPIGGNRMKQFFKLSFLNAFTQASAFKALENDLLDSVPENKELRYLGRKNEYHFYRAQGSLETTGGLRLPIDRETIFVSIDGPLEAGELPIHAFKLGEDSKVEKYYFGDLERRFYEVCFHNQSHTIAGVKSWFIESNQNSSFFNTKTLSTVLAEEK